MLYVEVLGRGEGGEDEGGREGGEQTRPHYSKSQFHKDGRKKREKGGGEGGRETMERHRKWTLIMGEEEEGGKRCFLSPPPFELHVNLPFPSSLPVSAKLSVAVDMVAKKR